ncbi:hypothetical protein CHLNCDRAFT_58530 [Chlorella variabilis]|uniref:Uncharacterized protein n=1 Tax=Chlorella variabilis TaxID=554065 RepID=E1ZKX3_CHLVA|nr:hypothetical protein CHLNCDRAFT_58530 [Chlorella variabilis]EFN53455.1 hypothetical protein CHLNCDRAFT_58530 [Chlorella variabilis]|eukprot:XP_005845557.1 hypothetical protein CHLNCDRAFT_58530 [Chlorella variabilis]
MSKALVLCLVLLAAGATVARAQDTLCPAGLEGPDCGMCAGGTTLGDEACANLTESYSGWCYSNHTWAEGSTAKSYDCTTEARGTDYASTVTKVSAHCDAEIKKCDVHFALGDSPLTCSGLDCTFDGYAVFCGYTKCSCDAACPTVNGVSLGYMLERLTGKTNLACEEGWPEALCSFDIEGLSAASGGFQAFCKASECREW